MWKRNVTKITKKVSLNLKNGNTKSRKKQQKLHLEVEISNPKCKNHTSKCVIHVIILFLHNFHKI